MLPEVVPNVDMALLTKDAQQYSADKALYEKMFSTSNLSEADGRDGEAGANRESTNDMQTGRNEHRNFRGGKVVERVLPAGDDSPVEAPVVSGKLQSNAACRVF